MEVRRKWLRRGLAVSLSLIAFSATTGCGSSSPLSAQGTIGAARSCSSATACQEAMTRIVGHQVLLPRGPDLTFASGLVGIRNGKTGFVGAIWYRKDSPLGGFQVYGPGQIIGSDLGKCGGIYSTPTATPTGRSVCWTHHASGYFQTRYVSGGLLYEAYGSDSLVHVTDVRSWALGLVDSYG